MSGDKTSEKLFELASARRDLGVSKLPNIDNALPLTAETICYAGVSSVFNDGLVLNTLIGLGVTFTLETFSRVFQNPYKTPSVVTHNALEVLNFADGGVDLTLASVYFLLGAADEFIQCGGQVPVDIEG